MKALFPLLAAAAWLAGCASSPLPDAGGTTVPAQRVLAPGLLQAQPGAVRVTIRHDSGVLGRTCTTRLVLNGKPVADMEASEVLVLQLVPASYTFVAWPDGQCLGGRAEFRTTLAPGATLRLRVGASNSGDYSLRPIEP